ncbi:MAG: hypothetical protein IJV94_03680 [Bacilli bacterium]|nr:hypothetical protein [Bacilli bacterium]
MHHENIHEFDIFVLDCSLLVNSTSITLNGYIPLLGNVASILNQYVIDFTRSSNTFTINEVSKKYVAYRFATTDNITPYDVTGDYNPAHKKYVDDAIAAIDIPENSEQTQSDWNQNDVSAVDYIKNKPFYVEKFPRTAYAESTNTFPIDFNAEFGNYGDDLAAFMTNGKGLVLTVDGIEYGTGVSTGSEGSPCFEFDDGNFVLKYGYLSSATTSNGYATYLDYLGSELDKTVAHEVTISTTEQKDIIHQIDQQFIPVDEMLAEDRQRDRVVYNWAEDDGDHIAHIYNKPFGHFYYNTTFSGVETFTQLLESTMLNGQ